MRALIYWTLHLSLFKIFVTDFSGLDTHARFTFLAPRTCIIVLFFICAGSSFISSFLAKRVAIGYSTKPVKDFPNPSCCGIVAVPAGSVADLFAEPRITFLAMNFVNLLFLQNFVNLLFLQIVVH